MTTILAKKYENLEKYVKEIKQKYTGIREKWTTSLDDAIRIGELLTQCKMKVEHGDWLPWVEKNLPFSHDTSSLFIRTYGRKEELKKQISDGAKFEAGGWVKMVETVGAKSQQTRKVTEPETIDVEPEEEPKQLPHTPLKKEQKPDEESSEIHTFRIKSLLRDKDMGRVWREVDSKIAKELQDTAPSARITDMLDKLSTADLSSYTHMEVYLHVKFKWEE